MIIELNMCDADREALGGPEQLRLDTERVLDTPADILIRWEAECGYPIEGALKQIRTSTPEAAAVLVVLWLARKQAGPDGGGQSDDGVPEPYRALAKVKTLRVGTRFVFDDQPEDADAIPPASTPAP